MKRLTLSRDARATLGTVTGGLSVAFGSAVQWGTGVGLMVGGVLAAAFCVLLYDVDDSR